MNIKCFFGFHKFQTKTTPVAYVEDMLSVRKPPSTVGILYSVEVKYCPVCGYRKSKITDHSVNAFTEYKNYKE